MQDLLKGAPRLSLGLSSKHVTPIANFDADFFPEIIFNKCLRDKMETHLVLPPLGTCFLGNSNFPYTTHVHQ